MKTTLTFRPMGLMLSLPLAVLIAGASGARAQTPAQKPPVTPNAPPAAADVPAQTQPSAPTPPTPLPTKTPDTKPLGFTKADIHDTTRFDFDKRIPGQPQPGDPDAIRTLDQALAAAYSHNPSILLAFERAVKTNATIAQILGAKTPSVTGSVTYNRLGNAFSASAVGQGGPSPAQIINPFTVGLQNVPPGSVPVSLASNSAAAPSTNSASSTSGAASGATTTAAGRAEQTGRQTATTGNGGSTTTGGSTGTTGTTGGGTTTGGTTTTGDTTGGSGGTAARGGGGGFSNALDQESARIQVTQFIDLTGILKAAQRLGDLEQALSRLELARLRQQTALDVRNGYYNVLRAAAFVRVNEAAVTDSAELLRVTQAQLRAGVASNFDVLRSQTQLDNNRQALIQSRNQLLIAKNAFANTLGVDPSTPVDLADIPDIPPLPPLDEAALLAKAFAQRPEYYQSDANILVSRTNTRLAHRNIEPYANVYAVAAHTFNKPSFGGRNDGSVGITFGVPLYDGGVTREAVKSARSDERTALIQKDQFVRGIKSEVQQAIIAVRDAFDRQSTTAATVAEATEALRLANVRYKAGVGTQLEINDAQTTLVQAENNQVNARYDYLTALARLSRSVGTPE